MVSLLPSSYILFNPPPLRQLVRVYLVLFFSLCFLLSYSGAEQQNLLVIKLYSFCYFILCMVFWQRLDDSVLCSNPSNNVILITVSDSVHIPFIWMATCIVVCESLFQQFMSAFKLSLSLSPSLSLSLCAYFLHPIIMLVTFFILCSTCLHFYSIQFFLFSFMILVLWIILRISIKSDPISFFFSALLCPWNLVHNCFSLFSKLYYSCFPVRFDLVLWLQ